jgi:hypothetical protein
MKNNGSNQTKRAARTGKRAKDLRRRDVSLTEQTKVGGGLISVRSEVASVATGGATFTVMTDGKPTSAAAFPSSGAATRL